MGMREEFESVFPIPRDVHSVEHNGVVFYVGSSKFPGAQMQALMDGSEYQGMWLAWQHLYPEVERLRGLVEAAWYEGWHKSETSNFDADQEWDASTTKAKLEPPAKVWTVPEGEFYLEFDGRVKQEVDACCSQLNYGNSFATREHAEIVRRKVAMVQIIYAWIFDHYPD